MSLCLEEIKLRNTEANIGYILDFEDERIDIFRSGVFVINIPFKDIDTLQEHINDHK